MSSTATSNRATTAATSRVSVKKLLVVFIATLVVGATAVVTANFWLDPMNYSTTYHRKAAAAFEAGKGFAIYDPTIDYRGLRREHFRTMAKTPEVVLFSGSRFELVHAGMFPGYSFYNSFVQRDYWDDNMAIAEILETADRMPKNLLLSVRLFSFRPHDKRPEGDQWKMFVPEAASMASRLNTEPPSRLDNFPWAHWLSLFSIDKLSHQIKMRWNHGGQGISVTDAKTLADMEVLHADGSLSFSDKHRKSFTPDAARAGSAKKAAEDRNKPVTKPDPKQLAQMKALLERLVAKGVNVAIVITPQHPAYWQGVAGSPYGQMLVDLENEVRGIATAAGAQFVGGFNPTVAGCPETAYRDFIHVENDCLQTIFSKIKLKKS